ncbi:short-chain dehydrogenase [Gordoniibacillus kamchatkensis]|uniref:Short-chain dehydrogenase n=1 Tax=Gordoniibacillus kamchatkensis TaxID=1590651 RepID=A0ABR5AJX3_9BACL|nr:glucose 1-dehydrogenase [Paenibacillus sp. VKM B-2647]KIL41314.1 short-chain dehydrogenase [Paenibacillus sp. VKM B-2647]
MTSRKTAIVTGASRGIGKGIALHLANNGYDLFLTHLDEQNEADEVQRQAAGYGAFCIFAKADLSHEDSPKSVAEQAIRAFGRVDVLVNNAGMTRVGKITEMPEADVDYLFHVNFRAPLLLMKYVAAHMAERQIAGSIVNIASSRAERAYPLDAVYGGLKAALVRATQSVALDLAPHRIRVNCVAPGATEVREQNRHVYDALGARIPIGRMGRPDDIAKAVAWLCSDEAAYITGINLRVDGGLILPGMPERASYREGWGQVP